MNRVIVEVRKLVASWFFLALVVIWPDPDRAFSNAARQLADEMLRS